MKKFRTMSGICSISDGEIHVKKGVREGVKSMYVGSKLYFFSVLLTVSWAIISIIFDSGIFVREIALWIIGAGILIGGMIGSATYLRISSNNKMSKNNIPINHINLVEFSNRGLSSVAVVNYQINGSERSLLLQFPYSSPLKSNREVETAKDVFERIGVEIREK